MLDTVLLDFDDTLHNTKKKKEKKFEKIEKLLESKGYQPRGSLPDAWSQVHRKLHIEGDMEKHDDYEYRMREGLEKVLDEEVGEGLLSGCVEVYNSEPESAYFFGWAEEFLQNLRSMNLEVYIFTTGGRDFKVKVMEDSGLDRYIDGLFESEEDFSSKKNDPEVYRKFLSEIDAEPEKTVMIGDKPGSDGMAKKVGIKTIIVKRGGLDLDSSNREESPNPDFTVGDLEEAYEKIREMKSKDN